MLVRLWSVRIQVADSEEQARQMEEHYLDSIPPEAGLIEMSSMYGLLNQKLSMVGVRPCAAILSSHVTARLAPPQDLRSHASPEKKATTTGDVEQGLTKRG